ERIGERNDKTWDMRVAVTLRHHFLVRNRQIIATDLSLTGENVGALDQIPELAQVPRKVIVLQFHQRRRGYPPARHLELSRHLMTEDITQAGPWKSRRTAQTRRER